MKDIAQTYNPDKYTVLEVDEKGKLVASHVNTQFAHRLASVWSGKGWQGSADSVCPVPLMISAITGEGLTNNSRWQAGYPLYSRLTFRPVWTYSKCL